MLVALMTAFTFTSCEDVPAPYDIPNGGNGARPLLRWLRVTEPLTLPTIL